MVCKNNPVSLDCTLFISPHFFHPSDWRSHFLIHTLILIVRFYTETVYFWQVDMMMFR